MSQVHATQSLPVAAWVGLDWADGAHEIRLQVEGRRKVEKHQLESHPEAIQEWLGELRRRFGGCPVAVCMEQTRNGLLYALMACEMVVIYAVNPQSLAKYRKLFIVSGAKGDASDAGLLLDLLRRHRDRLRVFQPTDVETRRIQLLCENRRKLVDQRARLQQQLRSVLKIYYPQALVWAGVLTRPWAWAFLKRWPQLQKLQAARPETVQRWYRSQKWRRPRDWQTHLEQIAQAQSLTDDEAVLSSSSLMVVALVGQLQQLSNAIERFDHQIEPCWRRHGDRLLFESFPGAGQALAPRLAAAFGSRRERFERADEVQRLSGIAPVTKQSGKSVRVLRRYACPRFLLQTFQEFAACSIPQSRWAKAYYQQQLERGCGHHAAVRALAYKWIRILFRCWKENTLYDEEKYCRALVRSNSPLASRLALVSAAA